MIEKPGPKQARSVWRGSPKWIKWGWMFGRLASWVFDLGRRRRRCLVIVSGSLGDALLVTGVIRELRRRFSGRELTLVVSQRAFPLLQRCPHADRILVPPSGRGTRAQIGRLVGAVRIFAYSYEAVLCPHASVGSDENCLAVLARGNRKVIMEWGTLRLLNPAGRDNAMQDAYETQGSESPASCHEMDRLILLMQCAGFHDIKSRQDIWPELYMTQAEDLAARTETESWRQRYPGVAVVAVCAGARFKQKDWGSANYGELLRQLGEARPVAAFLLGGEADGPGSAAIEGALSGCPGVFVINQVGKLDLHVSMAYIRHADLCVGNDTLGLHAAVAAGTPSVVVMWGGDNERWAPWGDVAMHRMIRSHDRSCFGCQGKCRWPEYRCMKSIHVDEVFAVVHQLLGNGEPRRRNEVSG